jgi:DNA-binding NarL/FixJ family response regulator
MEKMDIQPPLRVAIVEDDNTTRRGLAFLINDSAGLACAGEYRSMSEALAERLDPAPDVILLDIHLPGMLGSEGVGVLREKYPQCQVVMLTVYESADHVFESICNGACGYLLKKTPPAKLLDGIREAHQGGAPMSPEIARKVINLVRLVPPPPKHDVEFSPREQSVLELLSQGHSYTTIGERLAISVNTVRNNVRSIYEKLHAHSRSEAVAKASWKRRPPGGPFR